ncbi:MAG: Heat shock protein 60 family chaperone GroEL, partial [uncultured Rubrobacteraceae bacterium]
GEDPALQRRGATPAAGGRGRPGRHRQGDPRAQGPQRRARAHGGRPGHHERRRVHRAGDRALQPLPEHGGADRQRGGDEDERPHGRRDHDGHRARAGARPRGHAGDHRRREPDGPAPRDRAGDGARGGGPARPRAARAGAQRPAPGGHDRRQGRRGDRRGHRGGARARRRGGRHLDRGVPAVRAQRRVRRGHALRQRLPVAVHGHGHDADGDRVRGPVHP